MKEPNDKNLKCLIETITKSPLPDWAKTTMALSVTLEPLAKTLLPLIIASLFLNFLARLLGV